MLWTPVDWKLDLAQQFLSQRPTIRPTSWTPFYSSLVWLSNVIAHEWFLISCQAKIGPFHFAAEYCTRCNNNNLLAGKREHDWQWRETALCCRSFWVRRRWQCSSFLALGEENCPCSSTLVAEKQTVTRERELSTREKITLTTPGLPFWILLAHISLSFPPWKYSTF